MARSRTSARQAGARFERLVADYLRDHVDDRIDRRVKTGARDCGDIGGVRMPVVFVDTDRGTGSGKVVIEAKDCATLSPAQWVKEAEVERVNDAADVGLVAFKARGKGDPGDQYVLMTLRDLATLLSGRRPDA
jgi:hypothetical protein